VKYVACSLLTTFIVDPKTDCFIFVFLFTTVNCFIAFIAFIILPMYYGRFLSEIKLD